MDARWESILASMNDISRTVRAISENRFGAAQSSGGDSRGDPDEDTVELECTHFHACKQVRPRSDLYLCPGCRTVSRVLELGCLFFALITIGRLDIAP